MNYNQLGYRTNEQILNHCSDISNSRYYKELSEHNNQRIEEINESFALEISGCLGEEYEEDYYNSSYSPTREEVIIRDEERRLHFLKAFDIYISNPLISLDDFVLNNQKEYNVNGSIILFYNFEFLCNYFDNDTIKKFIYSKTAKTKPILFLKDYAERITKGNSNIEEWLFDNIKEFTEYTKDELKVLAKKYERKTYSEDRSGNIESFKIIISEYFNTDTSKEEFSTLDKVTISLKKDYKENVELKIVSMDFLF